MQIKGLLGAVLVLASAASSVFRGIGKTETADAIDACAQAVPDVVQAIGSVLGGLLLYQVVPKAK